VSAEANTKLAQAIAGLATVLQGSMKVTERMTGVVEGFGEGEETIGEEISSGEGGCKGEDREYRGNVGRIRGGQEGSRGEGGRQREDRGRVREFGGDGEYRGRRGVILFSFFLFSFIMNV
jgi:hypothetical protein